MSDPVFDALPSEGLGMKESGDRTIEDYRAYLETRGTPLGRNGARDRLDKFVSDGIMETRLVLERGKRVRVWRLKK